MRNIYLLSLLVLFSCKKNASNNPQQSYTYNKDYEPANAPEALQQNDAVATGIYKGVAINSVDSVGTFKFNIANADSHVYALFYSNNLIKDSLIRYLTNIADLQHPAMVDTSSVNGLSIFSGNFYSYQPNSDPYIYFTVNPQTSATANIKMYSNFTISAVLKEKSNNQVFCYEGSYSGADNGKMAFVVSADEAINIGTSNKTSTHFSNETTVGVSSGKFVLNGQIANLGLVVFNGTYDKNICSGTWTVSNNPSIINSFFCKRTL